MKKLPLIITLFIVLSASLGAKALDAGGVLYEDTLDNIDKAIGRQQWAEADSLITTALRMQPGNPSNPLLLSNLGMVRFYAGHDSLALATLDAAHAMAPSSVTVLANRARVLTAVNRPADAIADYNLIEQLDSLYTPTYLYRGFIYLYGGAFEQAAADLKRLEQLAPDDVETSIALAAYHTIMSQPEEALPHYTRLIKVSPSADYYAGRALALLELDRLQDAAEDIADGLELDPESAELYLCRAILNKKRYEGDSSMQDAAKAMSLGANPERVKALLDLK